MKKSQIELAAKKGVPVYSKTGRWIKGWKTPLGYVPNPEFTVDNVMKMRLLTLETINNLLKKGFELDKDKSYVYGDTGHLVLNKGNKTFSFSVDADEYKQIVNHIK